MAKRKPYLHKAYWMDAIVVCSCGDRFSNATNWLHHYASSLGLNFDDSEDHIRTSIRRMMARRNVRQAVAQAFHA